MLFAIKHLLFSILFANPVPFNLIENKVLMIQTSQVPAPVIVPVILCGGSGTRLWPASRESHPKQFLSLTSETSLLQNTVTRALAICGAPASSVVVVTLAAMKDLILKQLGETAPDAANHILCEPMARNTAAAVCAAALYVSQKFGDDAVLWVLPSDHHIGDETALKKSFECALTAAKDNKLVTFGIEPTRPDTGYGYIRAKPSDAGKLIMGVEEFVEKPNLETAKKYLQSGHYMWNSGMFLFSAKSALNEFQSHSSDVLLGVTSALEKDGTLNADEYAKIPSQPFDKAVMEKSAHICVVPTNPDWSDIGSWESLWDICEKDENNNVLDGNAVTLNTQNSLVHSKKKLIAVAGLDNIVVVETDDAILIMNKQDNDSMRELIKKLKDSGAREVA